MRTPRRIGVLVFDEVMATDITGPADAFHTANGAAPEALYEIVLIGETARTFRAEAGIAFQAEFGLTDAPPLDTLLIPGGRSLRRGPSPAIVEFIRDRSATTRRLVSVCTGFYALAATGLLDDRRATTHWRYVDEARRCFPAVRLEPEAIFIRDGAFHTSAGVTAGIDLALALIEADHGPALALEVARELVVFFKRPGGQTQYSEQLQSQVRSGDRFADLAAWIPGHLKQDLSVEVLAARVNLSPRHFSRRFTAQFGASPGEYVARLRLEAAARLLAGTNQTVDAVAEAVGYRGDDVFRRAFTQQYGSSPAAWRSRTAS